MRNRRQHCKEGSLDDPLRIFLERPYLIEILFAVHALRHLFTDGLCPVTPAVQGRLTSKNTKPTGEKEFSVPGTVFVVPSARTSMIRRHAAGWCREKEGLDRAWRLTSLLLKQELADQEPSKLLLQKTMKEDRNCHLLQEFYAPVPVRRNDYISLGKKVTECSFHSGKCLRDACRPQHQKRLQRIDLASPTSASQPVHGICCLPLLGRAKGGFHFLVPNF